MRKRIEILLLIILCVTVTACGEADTITKVEVNNEEVIITETEADSEGETNTEAEAASEEETITKQEKEQHDYIPDKSGDSYYSLIDDQVLLDVKSQQSGTCWTCAITSSIEGTYYKEYNEKVSFDATDLCLRIYDDDKTEGWFVHRDKLDYGGWDWLACDYLPNGYDGYYLNSAWRYDEKNSREELKDGIRKHGPISIAVCDNSNFKSSFDGYYTMNDDNPDHLDHAVIIIGWDDNFPKEYFRLPAKENGAWICQNSKSKGWGNKGTYMISYESVIDETVIFSMTKEYSDVAYYDSGNEKQITTGDTCSVANVFNKKGKLAAIGTYTNEDYQKYKIEIYDGVLGKDNVTTEETLQKRLAAVDGVSDIKGYHVVNLPSPIDVENYTVVVTFDGQAPVEGESYNLDDGAISYVSEVAEGQSFVLIDNKWIDMSSDNIKSLLGIDFRPGNACIKALYK